MHADGQLRAGLDRRAGLGDGQAVEGGVVQLDLALPAQRGVLRQAQQRHIPPGQTPAWRGRGSAEVAARVADPDAGVDGVQNGNQGVRAVPFEEPPVPGRPAGAEIPAGSEANEHTRHGGGLGCHRSRHRQVPVDPQVNPDNRPGTGAHAGHVGGKALAVPASALPDGRGEVPGHVAGGLPQPRRHLRGTGRVEFASEMIEGIGGRRRWAQAREENPLLDQTRQEPVDDVGGNAGEVRGERGGQIPEPDRPGRQGHRRPDRPGGDHRDGRRRVSGAPAGPVLQDHPAVLLDGEVVGRDVQARPDRRIPLQAVDHRGEPDRADRGDRAVPAADTQSRRVTDAGRSDPGEQPERRRPGRGAQQVAHDRQHRTASSSLRDVAAVADLAHAVAQGRACLRYRGLETADRTDLPQPRPPRHRPDALPGQVGPRFTQAPGRPDRGPDHRSIHESIHRPLPTGAAPSRAGASPGRTPWVHTVRRPRAASTGRSSSTPTGRSCRSRRRSSG